MRKTLTCGLLALLCLPALVGCRGGANDNSVAEGADPEAVIAEVNSFTNELLEKVDSAGDPSAGVDEAQKLLDARKDALRARIDSARRSRKARDDEKVRDRLLECEVDNTDRVSMLHTQARYLDLWRRDAVFKSKLDKLVADYKSLFTSSGPLGP